MQQQYISINGAILPGSVTIARSRCGKRNCACHKKHSPGLHGPYYRWSGFVDGKRTTITITKDAALECAGRIRNFRKLQQEIHKLVRKSLANAPWISEITKSRKKPIG